MLIRSAAVAVICLAVASDVISCGVAAVAATEEASGFSRWSSAFSFSRGKRRHAPLMFGLPWSPRKGVRVSSLPATVGSSSLPVAAGVPREIVAGMRSYLVLGTRESPLALKQTEEVKARLEEAWPDLQGRVRIKHIRTTGDVNRDVELSDLGGKGLFTRELDADLLDETVDVCVHSMKDVPTTLPESISTLYTPKRGSPLDAFISPVASAIQELPPGAVLGTASLRRRALALHLNPQLCVTLLRGTVHTRLRKLNSGKIAGTLLAVAGLQRLGISDSATRVLSTEDMLPAVAQGAIAMQCRTDDSTVRRILNAVHDEDTWRYVSDRPTYTHTACIPGARSQRSPRKAPGRVCARACDCVRVCVCPRVCVPTCVCLCAHPLDPPLQRAH
eukprot:GHVU01053311.1.p1 GENE.GHVU01053311.1~~GHVU01053311.1.p1  ORF type:complete len:389 (-),score=33.95 GHVU01053311.1:1163-2329(-)